MKTAPGFSKATRDVLAKRAGQTCSNPGCRAPTSRAHTQGARAVTLGEAAHIKGARAGAARFDPNMIDEERAASSNGIWLCCVCAKLIDSDADRYTDTLLISRKTKHEAWVEAGRPAQERATREITVVNGGIGSTVNNQGFGTALEIVGAPGQTAERIHVKGRGIGEVITNTGLGTAKIVRSSGARAASESRVTVDQPVRIAAAVMSTLTVTACPECHAQFMASKVVQAFAGDEEPRLEVKCPKCGRSVSI